MLNSTELNYRLAKALVEKGILCEGAEVTARYRGEHQGTLTAFTHGIFLVKDSYVGEHVVELYLASIVDGSPLHAFHTQVAMIDGMDVMRLAQSLSLDENGNYKKYKRIRRKKEDIEHDEWDEVDTKMIDEWEEEFA